METKQKDAKAQTNQQPKTDNVIEIGKNLPAVQRRALGLPQTIEAVELLHKKIMYRTRLEVYIDSLLKFEIKKDEEDLQPTNYYAGCKLEIKDDDNRSFTLKHPQIIKEVIDFMKTRFTARQAEIDAEIVLPKVA